MKVNDVKKKLVSHVIDFDSDHEDTGNYDEINVSMAMSDVPPIVSFVSISNKLGKNHCLK